MSWPDVGATSDVLEPDIELQNKIAFNGNNAMYVHAPLLAGCKDGNVCGRMVTRFFCYAPITYSPNVIVAKRKVRPIWVCRFCTRPVIRPMAGHLVNLTEGG